MKSLKVVVLLLLAVNGYTQVLNPDRYLKSIFTEVYKFQDIAYGVAPQWYWPYPDQTLLADVYLPLNDGNYNRPLIILAHSGGFINGSKDVDDMVALCDSFARKGFVTISIEYRKGMDPLDSESAERAVYRGIQDAKAAIRYFKQFADIYGVDTNYVFFGGMSAGGFMALHAAYMDKESERPASTYGSTAPDLGCLDCSGNSYTTSSKIKAALDYWGALGDTLYIESPNDPPVLIMHGANDGVVPYNTGNPFGLSTLPTVYGGLPTSIRCNNVGVPNTFITSYSSLHMLDGSNNGSFDNPPNAFWSDTLLPETTRFLYDLIKPQTQKITNDTIICSNHDYITLKVNYTPQSQYIWINTDSLDILSPSNEHFLNIHFPDTGNYQIGVVEFNSLLCAGDTLWFNVIVKPQPPADFTYQVYGDSVIFYSSIDSSFTHIWSFGNGDTSTEWQPFVIYNNNGEYLVSLTIVDSLGCKNSSSDTVSIYLSPSFSLHEKQENFIVYPNPFDNYVNIQSIKEKITAIEVYSITGKLVKHSSVQKHTHTVNLSNLDAGVYFITITTLHQRKTIKVIKER